MEYPRILKNIHPCEIPSEGNEAAEPVLGAEDDF